MKFGGWKSFRPKLVPKNNAVHQENRANFCEKYQHSSFGGDGDSVLWVDIDEKSFYSYSQRIVYVPEEFAEQFRYLHVESKTNIESVMFFGAVARPRPKYNFDGRVLLIPVCEKRIRKRNGKYGKKGDIFYVKVYLIISLSIINLIPGEHEQATLYTLFERSPDTSNSYNFITTPRSQECGCST